MLYFIILSKRKIFRNDDNLIESFELSKILNS